MRSQLPPFRALETALGATTERLAHELAAPTLIAPEWTQFEWGIARAVAAMQGISGLLARGLRWRGPADWSKFLVEQEQQTQLRQQRVAEICSRLDASMRRRGICVIALKGAALHDIGVYRPGERPMGDVDLLIRPLDVDAVAGAIAELGYREAYATRRHRVFEPDEPARLAAFGEHAGNPLQIEVHTHVAEGLPIRAVDITSDLWPRTAVPGLNRYSSTAMLMKHLLLHAAGNMRSRALRGIQLHDIALLAGRMNAEDWRSLIAGGVNSRWWMLPPLLLTARYYGDVFPADLMNVLRRDCPALLRRIAGRHALKDVSWSKIRIQAFPGMEWVRSPKEAAMFAKSRIWPSHRALTELRIGAVHGGVDRVVPWYGQSHPVRILRWIFSRPPRVQTMRVLLAMRAGETPVSEAGR